MEKGSDDAGLETMLARSQLLLADNSSSAEIDPPNIYGCFNSESDCSTYTKSCGGKGKCVKSGLMAGSCFLCQCDKAFAGPSCEFEDIVASFHLVFWITLLVIILITAGLFLLLSADSGSEGLVYVGGSSSPRAKNE